MKTSVQPFVEMPNAAPLPMPMQDLTAPFRDPNAPELQPVEGTRKIRWATFAPAAATVFILILIFSDWFRKDGFAGTEIAMLFLMAFTSFWIALSVSAATIGLFAARKHKRAPQAAALSALDVALLVPVYNEDPKAVFSRLQAMHDDLTTTRSNHRFAMFVLSDTTDPDIAAQEAADFADFSQSAAKSGPTVFYRRREKNIERKTGNLRNWIEGWGASWDAFITLDADSLMSARTITQLADEMATNQDAALIQSVPHLMGAQTVFSRVQQFANNVYGRVLASGLERWSGHDGNYWGHNAIIRTRAFAACAGLPRLQGSGALGGTIKSHDFVEAALLRRAGWSVRLLPQLQESYEETPQTLVDYVLRDRRWCQGNLQHLKLLKTPGLKNASRFHMVQGAMAYIASVVWFVLLVLWALMGRSESENVFRYFTDTNPLFPQWPEMDFVSRALVLSFMLGLLLVPKIFGMIDTLIADPSASKLGGHRNFFVSALSEIFLSFLIAPILMVQHMIAVLRTVIGLDAGWSPQNREGKNYSVATLLRFHCLETLVGSLLVVGVALGIVSWWLAPIAFSLTLAVPISWLFGQRLPQKGTLSKVLETEEEMRPPSIIVSANRRRAASLVRI